MEAIPTVGVGSPQGKGFEEPGILCFCPRLLPVCWKSTEGEQEAILSVQLKVSQDADRKPIRTSSLQRQRLTH